jgi:YVTN family beta-propeller protein
MKFAVGWSFPLLVALFLVGGDGTPAVAAEVASPVAGERLYVSAEDGGEVVVVDPATAAVVGRIPVGKRPRGMKLSPDQKLLYVALSGSPRAGPGVDESKLPPGDRAADGIGVVDLAGGKLVRTYQSGQDPESLDVSRDGTTLFVSNEETAEVSVLDVASGKVTHRVAIGREPEGVTVRPDGKMVYVTSEQDSDVAAIDTRTFAVVARVPGGPRPRTIVFAPGGRTAFVTDEMGAMVTVLDTARNRPAGTIKIEAQAKTVLGPRPMGAVVSRDGKQLYVSNGRGESVSVIDVAARKQTRIIDGVGARPWGIALSGDGRRLYTANGPSDDVSIIDIASGKVTTRVKVGGLPWGAVVSRPRR